MDQSNHETVKKDTPLHAMTSEDQLKANRKNAEHSTGPKSPEGKKTSSMNALKHGILSNHLFISSVVEDTDYKAFADFMELFFEEMQPIGMLETMLVDRLLSTHWRLRRLHIAETGFIKKQIVPHHMQQILEMTKEHGESRKEGVDGFFRRMRTSRGCALLENQWQAVSETIEEHGLPLSKGMTMALNEELGGESGFYKAECVSQCNWIVANNGGAKPMSTEDEKEINEYALKCAKDLQKFFHGISEILEMDEEAVRKADLQSKLVPSLDQLEKLQRYDAHLQRIFLQTLHELQRIQAARLGSPAPFAAALDVTINNE
jgi:hypothetical protein